MMKSRMTTGRWMVLIAVFAGSLGGLVGCHRWVTAMVADVQEQARARAGLPPGTNMNDFNMPVTSRQMFWLRLDQFLMKFWFVILALLLVLSFGLAMLLPGTKIEPERSAPHGESRQERPGNQTA